MFKDLVQSILVLRPPESSGSALVREVIKTTLEPLGWLVEENIFQTSSVLGERVVFSNVVATEDPNKPRHLVLACHYDSKTFPIGFLGATDSAVPCAIMLDIATSLDRIIKMQDKKGEVSLQLIFFDGEEQLYENTMFGPDGMYGSKQMAKTLQKSLYMMKPGNITELLDKLGLSCAKLRAWESSNLANH